MYSLNRATVLGNLTRDPESKQIPSGQNVCTFAVATNRAWKDASGQKQEQVEFHNVVAWGKLAEICGQYLAKGRKVYIEGRIQTRNWDGADGVKRYRTEIVADNMILLDRPPSGGGGGTNAFSAGAAAPAAASKADPGVGGEEEIRIEDIPF